MVTLIDIHTHNDANSNQFSVLSLSVEAYLKSRDCECNKFLSVGIHPWQVHKTDIVELNKLDDIASYKNVVAIGECGLDKNSIASIKEQGLYFERQVGISEKHRKPLIIHCVAAYNEIMQLHKKLNPKQNWILHGFRGKPQLALQLLNEGFYLSYGEKLNPESVAATPIDRLCIETDESELGIDEIYKTIALIKNCRPEELNAGCIALRQFVC